MNILFLGTDPAPYHPMWEVGEQIKKILPDVEIEMTSREEDLQKLRTGKYEICMLYTDFMQPPVTKASASALLSFVANAGGLFSIHGGIALQNRPELGQLFGGIFTGHPPYEGLPTVSYKVADPTHPLTAGVEDFAMPDEPYLFDLPALEDRHIFLSYEDSGTLYPAGWTREYGLGRVIYLCCGHNAQGFENPMLGKLLKNGVAWLAERMEIIDA